MELEARTVEDGGRQKGAVMDESVERLQRIREIWERRRAAREVDRLADGFAALTGEEEAS